MLLIGLVLMQVSLLKVNAGMGSDVERSAALSRGNALLQAEVSKLESNDRIQQLAIRAGMVLPTSDNVRYLGAGGRRVGGTEAAGQPSQGEASTALLPTVPTATTADGTTTAATTDPAAPTTTTSEPQTTSSVPDAAQAQQQADAAAAAQQAATTAAPTPPRPRPPPPPTRPRAPSRSSTAAPATGTSTAAAVGGATPGG